MASSLNFCEYSFKPRKRFLPEDIFEPPNESTLVVSDEVFSDEVFCDPEDTSSTCARTRKYETILPWTQPINLIHLFLTNNWNYNPITGRYQLKCENINFSVLDLPVESRIRLQVVKDLAQVLFFGLLGIPKSPQIGYQLLQYAIEHGLRQKATPLLKSYRQIGYGYSKESRLYIEDLSDSTSKHLIIRPLERQENATFAQTVVHLLNIENQINELDLEVFPNEPLTIKKISRVLPKLTSLTSLKLHKIEVVPGDISLLTNATSQLQELNSFHVTLSKIYQIQTEQLLSLLTSNIGLSFFSIINLENPYGIPTNETIFEVLKDYLNNTTSLCSLKLNGVSNHVLSNTIGYALPTNTCLTYLNLSENDFSQDNNCVLPRNLRDNRTLKTLILKHNFLNSFYTSTLFESLTTNHALTHLSICSTAFTPPHTLNHLENALKQNTTLTSLNLKNSSLQDFHAQQIANALSLNSTLCFLNLENHQISPTQMIEVAHSLKFNTTLTYLNIMQMDEYFRSKKPINKRVNDAFETLFKSNFTLTHLVLTGASPNLEKQIQIRRDNSQTYETTLLKILLGMFHDCLF